MTYSGPTIFAKALALPDDPATLGLTTTPYFAHWSFGLAVLSGQVHIRILASLAYMMPDYATRSFLEVVCVDTNNSELEVMFSVFQNGKLIGGGFSPANVLLYDGRDYLIDLSGTDEYLLDH
jgi:hypothetical protein